MDYCVDDAQGDGGGLSGRRDGQQRMRRIVCFSFGLAVLAQPDLPPSLQARLHAGIAPLHLLSRRHCERPANEGAYTLVPLPGQRLAMATLPRQSRTRRARARHGLPIVNDRYENATDIPRWP